MAELVRRLRIDGGSFGPADPVVIEQFFTNRIHGGEERLMLAVLQDAVECFQAARPVRESLGTEAFPRGTRLDSGQEFRLVFFV